MEDYRSAVEAGLRAVALEPEEAIHYVNLAIAYEYLGELEKAEAAHRRCIALEPDEALSHWNFALFLEEAGRMDEAKAEWREALRLAIEAGDDVTEAEARKKLRQWPPSE